MTSSTVLAAIALTCSIAGLGCLGAGWLTSATRPWRRRGPERPAGRHRAPTPGVPPLSATAMLLAARAQADALPGLARPTRAQLRDEAATR